MKDDKKIVDNIILAAKIIEKSLAYKAYINEIPALAFGIVYKHKLIYSQGYGFADRENKIRVTEQTCFRIASISKVFTATAIMQLVEKDKLRLDDQVSEHLSWFKSNKDKNLEKITIRQLLTHTSGIQRDGDTPHWVSYDFPTIAKLKSYVMKLELPFVPNTTWKYSNFGFAILGEVIRIVSGEESYDTYINKNIIDKLGMTSTASDLISEDVPKLVIGHGRKLPSRKREAFPRIKTNTYAPAAGFISNTSDLAKFISSWFKGNNILLTEESKRELLRIQWLRVGESFNQAVGLRSWNLKGQNYFGHSGGFQGFRTYIGFDISREIGLILLMNVNGIEPSIYGRAALEVIDYLLQKGESFYKPAQVKKKEPLDIEGTYSNIWHELMLLKIKDQLLLFDPALGNPFTSFAELEPIKNSVTNFKILSSTWDSAGEIARFEYNRDGKVKTLTVGATPYTKVDLF